ncbi:unnamed protein product [Rhizophagus irregularis]|nr:unnamed protein product [Rhizophagus irregularis]
MVWWASEERKPKVSFGWASEERKPKVSFGWASEERKPKVSFGGLSAKGTKIRSGGLPKVSGSSKKKEPRFVWMGTLAVSA